MMTPRQHAEAYYADCERGLAHWEAVHRRNGVVVDTPQLFAMGRPVNSKAPEHLILDPEFKFYPVDCWFVWYMSGSIVATLQAMPFSLPLACFERAREPGLHFFMLERIRQFVTPS